MTPPNPAAPARTTTLAFLANSLPPYRVHLHRRLAREIPGLHLITVLTHVGDGRWDERPPADLDVVSFAAADPVAAQGRPARALREWRKGGRIIRWLKRHQPRVDAVVVSAYNDLARLRVIRWCGRNRVPVFLAADSNVRDDTATGPRRLLKQFLLRRLLRRVTATLPFGVRGREYFARYGVPPDRQFDVPLEPDYDLLASVTPAYAAQAAADFNLPANRRRLLFSGRLVQPKRLDLLIAAFANIADERPDWDLIVLGDGDRRAAWQARVPAPLTPRVRFLGHVPDPRTTAAVYKACDVLVLPSDREPWALVVNEAAAAGLAIVASDAAGATADLVRDGVNGRVFRTGDLPHLTACLLEVTANPTRLAAMRATSASVLTAYRTRSDPVAGMRRALKFAGLLA